MRAARPGARRIAPVLATGRPLTPRRARPGTVPPEITAQPEIEAQPGIAAQPGTAEPGTAAQPGTEARLRTAAQPGMTT